MRTAIRVALAATALSLFGLAPALASSTGLHSIHALGKEGGALCMSAHFHYGAGSSDKSRKLAQETAIRAWADFVQLEYGSDWSSFGRAHDRQVNCSGAGGTYTCNVSARPCRGGVVAKPGKRKSAKRRGRRR